MIFAARDEAEKLPAALATLLAQDYPQFEVIAVNDRSQDQTPAILHEFERTSSQSNCHRCCQLAGRLAGKTARAGRGIRTVARRMDGVHGCGRAFRAGCAAPRPGAGRRAPMGPSDPARVGRNARLLGDYRDFVFRSGICLRQRTLAGFESPLGAIRGSRSVPARAPRRLRKKRRAPPPAHGRDRRHETRQADKDGGLPVGRGRRAGHGQVRWHSGVRNVIRGVTKNMFAACPLQSFVCAGRDAAFRSP